MTHYTFGRKQRNAGKIESEKKIEECDFRVINEFIQLVNIIGKDYFKLLS